MDTQLRCVHRHTIKEHPACFAQGRVKDNQPLELNTDMVRILEGKKNKKVRDLTLWYQKPGTRIGYLDIESDGLKADFSTMLTWCIKEKDGPIAYDVIQKRDLFRGIADRKIVQSIVDEISKYNIIVTYFGKVFDIPYIRTKAIHYGIDFPAYQEIAVWDLYFAVKSKLNLSRKSLDNVCDYFGIVGKTPLDKDTWRIAKYGDPEAIQKVLVHNMGDVSITEELHNKMNPFMKWIKTSI